MARTQTRKSISVSGETYTKLKKFATATNRTGSGVVEGLLRALLVPKGANNHVLESLLDGGNLVEMHTLFTPKFPLPGPIKVELNKIEKSSQELEVLAEREANKAPKARERGALYNGEKVPELDPDTKAHRLASSIFTF
jgi:hypothetical protein